MASKRRLRRKECSSKVRHADVPAAQAAIRALNRNKGYQGLLNTYHCRFCGGVHVGHAPQRYALH